MKHSKHRDQNIQTQSHKKLGVLYFNYARWTLWASDCRNRFERHIKFVNFTSLTFYHVDETYGWRKMI